jgi:hypothetical protein
MNNYFRVSSTERSFGNAGVGGRRLPQAIEITVLEVVGSSGYPEDGSSKFIRNV